MCRSRRQIWAVKVLQKDAGAGSMTADEPESPSNTRIEEHPPFNPKCAEIDKLYLETQNKASDKN